MALQLRYTDPAGVTHAQAYLRVKKFIIDNPINSPKTCSGDYEIYSSKPSRDTGMRPVFGPQGFTFAPGDANTASMATAYLEYLKLQSEFNEAVDV